MSKRSDSVFDSLVIQEFEAYQELTVKVREVFVALRPCGAVSLS